MQCCIMLECTCVKESSQNEYYPPYSKMNEGSNSPSAIFSTFPLLSTLLTSLPTHFASSSALHPRLFAFFFVTGVNKSDHTVCTDVSDSFTPTVEDRTTDSVTIADLVFMNYTREGKHMNLVQVKTRVRMNRYRGKRLRNVLVKHSGNFAYHPDISPQAHSVLVFQTSSIPSHKYLIDVWRARRVPKGAFV